MKHNANFKAKLTDHMHVLGLKYYSENNISKEVRAQNKRGKHDRQWTESRINLDHAMV